MPILGRDHVVPGVAFTTAHLIEPGIVRHISGPQMIGFGELDGGRSARLDAFEAAANGAGIETDYSADVENLLWRKFVTLAAGAGVCGISRQSVGELREDPELLDLFATVMDEIIAVGAAKGIELAGAKADSFKFIENASPGLKPSLLIDLERGNRLEIDWLSGTVTRLGRELGVPTPVNQAIWAALRPHAGGG